jgi:MYXO-CTERM domain-containing protein
MRDVERDFWDRQRVWTVWVPLLTSPEVLWLAVIVLAAAAVWQRRRAAAAIRKRWEDEEAVDQQADRSPDRINESPDHEVNR